MHLAATQHYRATPSRVHRLLTQEDFLADAARELGATEHRVAATADRSAVEATIESPAEVRAVVGATLTLLQETTWGPADPDGSRRGDVTISIPGAPVKVTAEVTLAPSDSGCTLSYAGELTVKVPIVGAAIEKAAAPPILKALETQEQVARRWLAEADQH